MSWLLFFSTGFVGLVLVAWSCARLWTLFGHLLFPTARLMPYSEKAGDFQGSDQRADDSAPNALIVPTTHLETAYLKRLVPNEGKGRTVTADEAFWSQDIDVIRRWALENLYEPAPDWGIILSGSVALSDLVLLAQMPEFDEHWCEYFIVSAYIRVGDVKFQSEREQEPDALSEILPTILDGQISSNKRISTWANRAMIYLEDQPGADSLSGYFNWAQKQEN